MARMARSKLRQRRSKRPPRLILGRFTPGEGALIGLGGLIVLLLVAMAVISLLGAS